MTTTQKVLVLGGTRFVGRHIVEALLAAGHTVTVLTRGQSPDELPDHVERLQGDREQGAAGLHALAGRTWDACIDVSGYTPAAVRASTEALAASVRRYVFVSTVSVYAEQNRHPVRETDPLLPAAPEDLTEVTGESYGPLKVTCERIVQDVFADRATILRPQIVAGPFDHTARYPYWPDRAAQSRQDGLPMLAPGNGSDHMQAIDARDFGRFAVRVLEDGTPGIFNVAGPRLTWAQFMTAIGAESVHWVDAATLEAQGIGWRDLPLYLADDSEQGGLMDVDATRALAAGLTLTDPATTAQDTRVWSAGQQTVYALTSEREAKALKTKNAM
ncbi:NAD-dependent epimerase/dehydratase family protein [Deinococcus sp. QL22]|uniref:NAD-dependent epimerase/dehydratase family protein n=1 Tax=Deinococcus sp. QL22 TaxID=2939437 RepID=UPI002016D578|nr:NAD-dependent epimerase/dehydratase family protein [Deinococcus sp. QL22]UQN07538.1 NAD-dependent epimerase/dehydratase family protein [Deinococcus sp. QL22]